MAKLNRYLLVFLLLVNIGSYSQTNEYNNKANTQLKWFTSLGIGLQMSGIKSEDFVSSNYSPLLNINIGKWLSSSIAFQIGYKGLYFNTISDDIKHYYSFLYGEAIVNINNIFQSATSRAWSLHLHTGPGYFYNYHYSKPNICYNMGVQNNFFLNQQLYIYVDITSIVGWDIYQGDEDILPGIMFGVTYLF